MSHGMQHLSLVVTNAETGECYTPGLDRGAKSFLVAWLPDGCIIHTKSGTYWASMFSPRAAFAAHITYLRFDDTPYRWINGPECIGRFDEVDIVEHGRFFKRELAAMIERATARPA